MTAWKFAEPGEGDLVTLIGACAQGDRTALRALFDRLGPQLLGIAQRIVGLRPAAEDVVQETFLQVWRNAGTFDPSIGASARAWIVSILRYRALDMRERERRRTLPDERTSTDIGEALGYDRVTRAYDEETAALQECLGRLAEPVGRSLRLAYLDGFSHPEIAERLGSPIGTIKSWVRRGLESLKRCLEQ